jgi:hypothetical protein
MADPVVVFHIRRMAAFGLEAFRIRLMGVAPTVERALVLHIQRLNTPPTVFHIRLTALLDSQLCLGLPVFHIRLTALMVFRIRMTASLGSEQRPRRLVFRIRRTALMAFRIRLMSAEPTIAWVSLLRVQR